jgi:hypothetical protein
MYRKKPIEVEAVKNDGTWPPIITWLDHIGASAIPFGSAPPVIRNADGTLSVVTVDGNCVKVPVGAYLVRDTKGFFYPCDAEIFEASYEEIK